VAQTLPEAMHSARVTRSWAASDTLRGLAFVAEEVQRRHHHPGQYLRVRLGGEDNPYALASEPGAAALELLFKTETELTGAMAALAVGDTIQVGVPQGKGFPVENDAGRDLILCAAGTGIAPLRAVVRTILPVRARYGVVTLYYGQRTRAHFAYVEEMDDWRAAGIAVHLVASDASGGRVQDAVAANPPATAHAVAYVCGMKPMIADLSKVFTALGLPRERILLNF
jgi:sulfhydrogenase subunit gamma (sulfur reductase)